MVLPVINSDRRRRILLLSKRLDEFAAARRELLRQLADLDAQASAAQLEHDSLSNLDAPISHAVRHVPDEILAMTFEEGMHSQDRYEDHFGTVVSHVTQRWRNVSIATPKLWNTICCIDPSHDDSGPYPERLIGRAFTFLSRARLLPLNIHIEGFRENHLSSNFLQLIGDHIERCRQLRVVDIYLANLTRLLEVISPRPMPLLASIDLASCDYPVNFKQQLFPSGAPLLTTATILEADISTIHLCLPAFQCLASFQFGGLSIAALNNDQEYRSLRSALMALPALRNLEISIRAFFEMYPRSPIRLPSIQHLHVHSCPKALPHLALDNLLRCIQAPYLVALSLSTWDATEPLRLSPHTYEHHFPSLQHLVVTNVASNVQALTTVYLAFPYIERLTFKPGRYANALLHNMISSALFFGIMTTELKTVHIVG